MPENSSEDSEGNSQGERAHRPRAPYVPSDNVSRARAPVTPKQRLDVDAVLERSIRKVLGEG